MAESIPPPLKTLLSESEETVVYMCPECTSPLLYVPDDYEYVKQKEYLCLECGYSYRIRRV